MNRRFLASKTYEIHVTASVIVKDLGGISIHVMAENWKLLNDTRAFSSFLVCKNRNRICLQVICCPMYHWLSVSRQ